MSKYWQLLKNWMARHLAYRARVLTWLIFDTINFIAFPFIWLTVYGSRSVVQGFNRSDIITYYVLVTLIAILASCHISRIIRVDIVRGDLNNLLQKPLNYFAFRSFQDVGYHLLFVPITAVLLVALAALLPQWFHFPSRLSTALLFIAAVGLGYLLSTGLEIILGLATFWFGETAGWQQVKEIAETLLSGKIAPLVFFPAFLQGAAGLLPFRFLASFPIQVYLGQLNLGELVQGFGLGISWVAALALIIPILWRRGLRRYDGASI